MAQQQLLMDTMLRGWKLPKFWIRKTGKQQELVDGQQRRAAAMSFLADDFKLASDMAPVDVDGESFEVAGMIYSELPQEVQEVLQQTSVSVVILEDCTPAQAMDYFLRLQNGSALNPAEKRRARGGKLPAVIRKICKQPIYKQVAFSADRLAHEHSAAQLFLLAEHQGAVTVSSTAINKLYDEYQQESPDSEITAAALQVLDLMAEIFPEPCKDLKKGAFSALFLTLYDELMIKQRDPAQLSAMAEDIYHWFADFSERVKAGEVSDEYQTAASKAVDRKEHIQIRFQTMQADLTKVLPEIKVAA